MFASIKKIFGSRPKKGVTKLDTVAPAIISKDEISSMPEPFVCRDHVHVQEMIRQDNTKGYAYHSGVRTSE